MADSKNQRFTSVKLCVIVGSVVTSRATPTVPQDENRPRPVPPHCARGSVRSSETTFAWLSAQFSCHCSILSSLAAVDGGRCPIHKVNFTKGVNEWGETRSGRASETPAADPRPARSASVTWRGLRALSAGEGSWLRLVTNTTSVKCSTHSKAAP